MNALIRRVRFGLPLIIAAALLVGPPGAGAATQTVGLHGWQVQSSAAAGNDGAALSRPGFAAQGWLKVAPDDGGAPGHRGGGAGPERPLPQRLLLQQHEAAALAT